MANLKINKNGNYVEVLISENGDNWKKLQSKAKKDLMDNLELKGFRKGNVPANIAEQNIKSEEIWNKAADMLIDDNYSEAIEMLIKESIATRPTFEIKSISNENIEGILKSVAMPNIKIGDRTSIKVDYEIEEVTDAELETELKQLDDLLMTAKESNDANKTIVEGDTTNIDFEGKVNGVAFDGGTSEGFDLKIGSKSFIDGFEDQVIGMKKGEVKDIEVTFPEQYPSEELKGQKAVFTVKVNSIKTDSLLEGEELKAKLKELGFESREEIVSRIKEVAAERKEQQSKDAFFRKYLDAIISLEDTEVTLPEEILEQEMDQEYKRMESQVAQQGMTMKEYLKMLNVSANEFKKNNLREGSIKRIKDSLIYTQLIADLKIVVEEADLNKEYEKIAADSKTTVEEVKKQIQKESIESNVLFNKLIDLLK